MGTRHRQEVITKEGELKIQQYRQWDGYPSGQGFEILTYLKKGEFKKVPREFKNYSCYK